MYLNKKNATISRRAFKLWQQFIKSVSIRCNWQSDRMKVTRWLKMDNNNNCARLWFNQFWRKENDTFQKKICWYFWTLVHRCMPHNHISSLHMSSIEWKWDYNGADLWRKLHQKVESKECYKNVHAGAAATKISVAKFILWFASMER